MLCRLCLDENIKDVVSCSDFPELAEIVKSALDVKMDEDNEYPRTVCVTCYDITMEYYAFRTRCLENQKTLRIRQIRQKVAEKIKSENEDDNDVVFVCETREEPTKETSEKHLKTYRSVKRSLKREPSPQKTFEQEMKKHKVSPCSVHVERLTQKDILQHLMRLRMYGRHKSISYTKKYNKLAYVNDHNYYRNSMGREPSKSVTSEHKSDIQIVRTYCRPNGEVMGEQSQPPAVPAPEPTTPPRIKVLSSAEINSRASQTTRQALSCTLINNRGRLEFSFTDAEANKIDFWSMSERQKRDVLNTLRPEKISQRLKSSFSMIPITKDTEEKLLSLYHGKIPFKVIVKD